jgi:hypothetical protein
MVAPLFESTEDQMGYPKGDWAQTRDPKRNAEITREVKKEAANEAAYFQALRERRAHDLPGIAEHINTHTQIPLNARKSEVDLAITDAANIPVAPESKILWWIALGGGLS